MDVSGFRPSAFLTVSRREIPVFSKTQNFGRSGIEDTSLQTLGDAEGGEEIIKRLFTLMGQGKLKWQWASLSQNKENIPVCFALDPQFIRPDGTKQRYGYWIFLPRPDGRKQPEGKTGILMKGEHQQDLDGVLYPESVLNPQHFEILKSQILKALGGPL
ncbi:MAG: hypothetical protein K2X66_09785 [Cyanobacteria bacterium]|nr:hypothetical protein [Cyanobacteriota bacterium]